jgi:hydroxypyruvate reductase
MNEDRTRQMKHVLRALYHYTIEEIGVTAALERTWHGMDPAIRTMLLQGANGNGSLFLVSFGKAAVPMTSWLLDKCGRNNTTGVLSAPSVPDPDWRGLECFAGGHPVPNRASLDAAQSALHLARRATPGDLVVFIISGGGSSLFEFPITSQIDLPDVRALYETLVLCGADIVDINVVRKHLSAVKGGRLAKAASPARQITLYISDVPPGQESSVASGPTMPDPSTLSDFRRIAAEYDLERQTPPPITALFTDSSIAETPKPGDETFDRSTWTCVLDNNDAVDAARRFAEGERWSAVPDVSVDDIDVAAATDQLLARLLANKSTTEGNGPVCIVSGGELRSPVVGSGVGGRNQAFVLECVPRIAGKQIAVLSAGTDGIDGNSPAAGAVADGRTLSRAQALGLDPAEFLKNSDSYSFFKILGDEIMCGPTQNNVRDIRVLVSW